MAKAANLEQTALGSREMLDDPYERFAYLRSHAPVSWATAPQLLRGRGGYLLTRFDDVMALHSEDRYSDRCAQVHPGRANSPGCCRRPSGC